MAFHVPNQYRVHIRGMHMTNDEYGNNGVFWIPSRDRKQPAPLRVIASDGLDWEHVSVSLPTRCPTWEEMCRIKGLFWDSDDAVMQLHPPEEDYVNNHPYCLHLWRPVCGDIPRPPAFMVGQKDMGLLV